ncbi:hypothetical protein GYMLUDRAFT_996854 [Collybiopsis luxurians FD-317 M1]|uniref:Uncharacterized protein n=1 Tax=Collybiopsis luxurians FD-317 M1 TaxID=944289 RepID=A0A0D0CGJ5_9AGAR|nr:hypothetical protein GYMLUDRAFT_996854 [Collybiopsis luxurians FD-317 M1]
MADISKQVQLEDAAVRRAGEISTKIREALRNALPAPPEQFFTVMVPGKVVDFDEYMTPSDVTSLLPTRVELAQARLCDDMPALAAVQLGPTGRSVARSYATAISKFVPSGSTIGVDEGSTAPLTEQQKRYKQAMALLSAEVPNKDGHTLVELYTIKQRAYTDAVSAKTKAFDDAMIIAQKDPANKTGEQVRAAYDRWVQENSRAYRNSVQAAYMDWVIMGKKEEVEYWFSVVDQDSALARVEQSKETMRWAIVQDSDGSGEYQKVVLTPSNWANLCRKKIQSGSNKTRTVEWYTFEISRLEKQNQMLEVLKSSPPSFQVNKANEEDIKKAEQELNDALANALKAEQTLKATPPVGPKPKAEADQAKWQEADTARKNAVQANDTAQQALAKARESYDKVKISDLTSESREAQNSMFTDMAKDDGGFIKTQIDANKRTIEEYTQAKVELHKQSGTGTGASAAIKEISDDMGIPKALPDPTTPPSADEDYFTAIAVEVSSSSESKSSKEEASSMSFGASASYGFNKVSVSHSQSQAHAEAQSELENASVKVSFECMRVDITRPWLRTELFYDEDLVLGPSSPHISPGFAKLAALLEGTWKSEDNASTSVEEELARYNLFPMIPTAFLVACNVVLEISGSTSKLQTMFNTSSSASSASVSVGFGPFRASGSASYSHSKTEASSKCESTASGCRISIESPQIIGWISEMIPALPRLK